MRTFLGKKTAGFYLLLIALILGVIATISYAVWGKANYAMNDVVVMAMSAGVAVNLLMLFADSDYLLVGLTALYSVGMFQLIADNAGSFADAYQGIVMFGDPTQVGAVLTMAGMIAAGVIAVILAGFLGRHKAP